MKPLKKIADELLALQEEIYAHADKAKEGSEREQLLNEIHEHMDDAGAGLLELIGD